MAHSDPIADMLTRIRNAVRNHAPTVNANRSKICTGIADVLKSEGYIEDYDLIDDGPPVLRPCSSSLSIGR